MGMCFAVCRICKGEIELKDVRWSSTNKGPYCPKCDRERKSKAACGNGSQPVSKTGGV